MVVCFNVSDTMVTPNPDFAREIAEAGGEEVKLCFQCGTCTAGCPSGRQTSYRVRKLMRMAQLGMKEEIINSEELWQCSTCYTCVERCPRQVPVVDIIVSLRNIAVADGHMYDPHKKTAQNLASIGHAVPVSDKISALRAELGLPEVPPTVLSNEAAMSDFSKLLKATGFDKIVE